MSTVADGMAALAEQKEQIAKVCGMRDKGMSVEQIFAECMRDMLMSAMDSLLGFPAEPPRPVPDRLTTPGFYSHDGGTMPLGLAAHDDVYVIYKDGLQGRGMAMSVDWSDVREWKLAFLVGFKTHERGSCTMPVAPGTAVDAEFYNARMARGVLADDVDWQFVTYYRVVKK